MDDACKVRDEVRYETVRLSQKYVGVQENSIFCEIRLEQTERPFESCNKSLQSLYTWQDGLAIWHGRSDDLSVRSQKHPRSYRLEQLCVLQESVLLTLSIFGPFERTFPVTRCRCCTSYVIGVTSLTVAHIQRPHIKRLLVINLAVPSTSLFEIAHDHSMRLSTCRHRFCVTVACIVCMKFGESYNFRLSALCLRVLPPRFKIAHLCDVRL